MDMECNSFNNTLFNHSSTFIVCDLQFQSGQYSMLLYFNFLYQFYFICHGLCFISVININLYGNYLLNFIMFTFRALFSKFQNNQRYLLLLHVYENCY